MVFEMVCVLIENMGDAWFGSASSFAEGNAALRSASLEARLLALTTLLTLAPLQNVRSQKFFFFFFISV